ncbi:hypothetical protein GSI_11192 [Ganoderma sinense ZZ0214-1]|uniref:Uncharacterized protein n=1 Tax=Ganoderma sinense ZZ0214-1 TaxID=1077348 RepID=A0A2G8RYX4_9APHY|nr:hypothetical protein GSI_11192 [Ganoderma sinense ZZ0214-1]
MPRPSLCAYSLISTFILSLISPSIASVPTLEMDAPQPITECAEDTFTWRGGLPPYTLSLRDARSGAPVFSNGSLTDTVFHWVAAVAAGTSLIVELTDTGENGAGPARISDSFTFEFEFEFEFCGSADERRLDLPVVRFYVHFQWATNNFGRLFVPTTFGVGLHRHSDHEYLSL